MTHLDLGGEVLHDGADELGLIRGEGGGVAARGGGFGGVVHGGGDVVLALVCDCLFWMRLSGVVDVRSRSLLEVSLFHTAARG